MQSDSLTLSCVIWALLNPHQVTVMASKDPKRSKQCAAGKKKHLTLMIPQKPEIIRRPESGNRCSLLMVSYNTGS